jgi:hypothetical protein
MNCHRIGTIRKIEARLAAYHQEAIEAGKTPEEAMKIAKAIRRGGR